jgi:hypothetical protein
MHITFTHNGKEYSGELSKVQGAGATGVYHLIINKVFKGRLRFSTYSKEWVFDGEFSEHAKEWGKMVEASDISHPEL